MTRDANRLWQVAPRLSDRQFPDRQRVPPSSANQAQLRKLPIIAHVSQTLRAFDTDTGEPAWEQRVVWRLTTSHDNYLRPMQNDLSEQCNARYSLQPDLGDAQPIPQMSGSVEVDFKGINPAHARLRDDRLNGPMRPTT